MPTGWNCQSTKYNEAVCAYKKCQATKCSKKIDKNCQMPNIWPVKPAQDMQSMPGPANYNLSPKKKDKNCQFSQVY